MLNHFCLALMNSLQFKVAFLCDFEVVEDFYWVIIQAIFFQVLVFLQRNFYFLLHLSSLDHKTILGLIGKDHYITFMITDNLPPSKKNHFIVHFFLDHCLCFRSQFWQSFFGYIFLKFVQGLSTESTFGNGATGKIVVVLTTNVGSFENALNFFE